MSQTVLLSPREHIADEIGRLWWLPLLRGILLIVLGIYALLQPGLTAVALTQVIGFFLILDGALAVAAGVMGHAPSRGWTILRGVAAVLLGIAVLMFPVLVATVTGTALMYLIGAGAVVLGILEIVAAIRDRKEIEGEGWLMLAGALAILFGVLLLIAPLAFGLILIRILGVYIVLYGIALIAMSFRVRRFGKSLAA